MAAAGSVMVRPAKGLCLIFSLVCLVCLADSLLDKDELKKIMEHLQNIKQDAESIKAEDEPYDRFISELLTEQRRFMNAVYKLLKDGPQELKPLQEMWELLMKYIDNLMPKMAWYNDDRAARNENIDMKLAQIEALMKRLELMRDEL